MPKNQKHANVFHDYIENRITLQQAYNMSESWYNKRISELRKIKPEDLLRNKGAFTKSPRKGEIYCFMYDPKHKDTLPYYDTFPLVLPLSYDNDSFLGLNFHYLTPKDRFFLLQAIKKYGKGFFRLNISWEVVATFANSNHAKHCLKRYLFSHMQTPLRVIRHEDIPTALLLPVERFAKKSKQAVWKDGGKF